MTYIDFTLEETKVTGTSYIAVRIFRVRMDGLFRYHVWYKAYDDDTWTLYDSAFLQSYDIEIAVAGTYQVRVQTERITPRTLEPFDTAPMKSITVTLTSGTVYTGTFQTSDPTTGDYATLDDDDTVRTYRSSVLKTELSDMMYTDSLKALTAAGLTLAEDGGALGVFIQDSTGYVGIAHNAPTSRLHVKATSDSIGRIEQVSADATGPKMELIKRRGATDAGVANDDIGTVLFTSHDDQSPAASVDYASILAEIADPTAAAEEGKLTFSVMDAGALTGVAKITSDGLEILSGNIIMQASATVDGVDVSVHAANTTTLHPDPAGQTNKYLKSDGSVYTWSSSTVAAHASTHAYGQSDEIDLADIGTSVGSTGQYIQLQGASEPYTINFVDDCTPSNHNLIDTTKHPVSGLTTGHFLKATGATSYAFGAHGLTYSDVGAASSSHGHTLNDLTGTLGLSKGGTNQTSWTANKFIVYDTAGTPVLKSSSYDHTSFAAASHNHSGVYASISHVNSTYEHPLVYLAASPGGDAPGFMSGEDKRILDAGAPNWDTAYSDRLKWDGGSTGLTAATGRTSLQLGNSATKDVGTGSSDVAAGNHVQTVANGGTGNDNTAIPSDRLMFYDESADKILGLTPGTAISDKSAYSTSPIDIGVAARMVDLNNLKDTVNTILARLRSAYVIAT